MCIKAKFLLITLCQVGWFCCPVMSCKTQIFVASKTGTCWWYPGFRCRGEGEKECLVSNCRRMLVNFPNSLSLTGISVTHSVRQPILLCGNWHTTDQFLCKGWNSSLYSYSNNSLTGVVWWLPKHNFLCWAAVVSLYRQHLTLSCLMSPPGFPIAQAKQTEKLFVPNQHFSLANCALGKPKPHKHIQLHFALGQLVAQRCLCGKASRD